MQVAKHIQRFVYSIIVMILSLNVCFAAVMPLPGNEAFIFTIDTKSNANQIFAHWEIAPGYYLYRDRLKIKVAPNENVEKIIIPQGEFKVDPNLGRVEIYKTSLSVSIILKKPITSGKIVISYQGCSAGGFCYPPMKQVNLIGNGITTNTTALLTDQNQVSELLTQHNLMATLSIFLFMGLLLAFTPCVLPMIPILTGIIVGQKTKVSTKRAFILSLSYVAGSSVMYAIAGLAAASMGSSLQAYMQQPIFIISVSGILVFLATSLFGFYHLRLPSWLQQHFNRVTHKPQGGNFFGVFAMGAISTLIVSPCVTAPLIGVLIYIGQTGDKLLGAAALFSMGIGMGIPLLLIGMSAGRLLPKSGPWMVAVKEMFGILLLGMALWLLARILPEFATKILWVGFVAGALTYIITNLARAKQLQRKWMYTLGVIAGLASLVLIAGSMREITSAQIPTHNFIVVNNVDDLQKQLQVAQQNHKNVLLDFYADWCESCVQMDKDVFDQTNVQDALKNYTLIRADLSANEAKEEQLMQKYAVFAPPTVLLFDKSGIENDEHRIVGEVNVKEFLSRLNHFETSICANNKIQC